VKKWKFGKVATVPLIPFIKESRCMKNKRIIVAYLALLTGAEPCHAAAAAEQPSQMTLFQAIGCAIVNKNRAHSERITTFPKSAEERVYAFAENKHVVGANIIQLRGDTPDTHAILDCDPIFIPKMLEFAHATQADIIALVGKDERGRRLALGDNICLDGVTKSLPLELGFNPDHVGVWEAPSDIELFLATPCENFTIKKSILHALAAHKQRSKNDDNLMPIGDIGQEAYPAPLLPVGLRNIVIDYLGRKTIALKNVAIMKADGTIVRMGKSRPLLPSERVAYMTGYLNLRSDHHAVQHPLHVLVNSDLSVLPAPNHPRLTWIQAKSLSVQTATQAELVALATRHGAALPNFPADAPAFTRSPHVCAGNSTMLVPSLAQLVIQGRLSQQLIDANKGFVESDTVPDCGPKVQFYVEAGE
jgi:hypothetical protein